jgi:hypothetical protein
LITYKDGANTVAEPKKILVSTIADNFSQPVNVFICSGSFEDRCRVIPDALAVDFAKYVFVCENENLKEVVGNNVNYLMQRFGENARKINLSTTNPLLGADNIVTSLESIHHDGPINFLIDISTFTHESLLILLLILRRKYISDSNISLQIAYTPAKEYSLGLETQDKWLSKGIGEIRSVLGYSGKILPSRKMLFLILLGFESERAMKLINAYEPSITSVGLGAAESSISERHHEINVSFFKCLREVHGNILRFDFSCIDPIATMSDILKQTSEYPNNNIVLAPMNNKISTIGAALAAMSDDRIQICYAHATQYNYDSYSTAEDHCYLLDLPEIFSDFGQKT